MAWNLKQYFNGTEISATRYADLIKDLLGHDMVRCPEYAKTLEGDDIVARRIHWECFYVCREQGQMLNYPWNKKGIYMHGHEAKVMYIGMTAKTFQERFEKRYFGPNKNCSWLGIPQFLIASRDECVETLKNKGVAGFRQMHPGCSITRIKHAEHFALAGMGDVWFALLPCKGDDAEVKEMEASLITQAKIENQKRGHTNIECRFLLNESPKVNGEGARQANEYGALKGLDWYE